MTRSKGTCNHVIHLTHWKNTPKPLWWKNGSIQHPQTILVNIKKYGAKQQPSCKSIQLM